VAIDFNPEMLERLEGYGIGAHLERILTDESPEALTRARRRQADELIGG
jgi:hypothetical protein